MRKHCPHVINVPMGEKDDWSVDGFVDTSRRTQIQCYSRTAFAMTTTTATSIVVVIPSTVGVVLNDDRCTDASFRPATGDAKVGWDCHCHCGTYFWRDGQTQRTNLSRKQTDQDHN